MWYRRFGKRLFDVVLAALTLTVLGPLLALVGLLIKMTSHGPVFYVQERIGKNGEPFPFIKFRTMRVGAEREGAGILCVKDDPRVTAIGRLLRRSSVDELPQLLNVLRGDMSVVGPRPGLAYQAAKYTPVQRGRLSVLPGITGWAQVNGRNSITWDTRIARDLEYVERMSFSMDVRILLRTLPAMFATGNQIADRDFFKDQTIRGTDAS
jgi:lipopolysaccharide/colanic/teichoic acid biosynthesis glycosyltransferase